MQNGPRDVDRLGFRQWDSGFGSRHRVLQNAPDSLLGERAKVKSDNDFRAVTIRRKIRWTSAGITVLLPIRFRSGSACLLPGSCKFFWFAVSVFEVHFIGRLPPKCRVR